MHHAILIYGAAARPALLPKERVCLPRVLPWRPPARRRVPLRRRRCSLLLYYCGCDIMVCLYVALPFPLLFMVPLLARLPSPHRPHSGCDDLHRDTKIK